MTRVSALSHFNRQINLQAINKKKLCVKVFSHLTRIDVWFLLVADALNNSNTFDDCLEFLSFLKPFNWRISRKIKIFYILLVIERNKNVLNVWCACWSVFLVLIWFFFFRGGRFSKISAWKNQTYSLKQGWQPNEHERTGYTRERTDLFMSVLFTLYRWKNGPVQKNWPVQKYK